MTGIEIERLKATLVLLERQLGTYVQRLARELSLDNIERISVMKENIEIMHTLIANACAKRVRDEVLMRKNVIASSYPPFLHSIVAGNIGKANFTWRSDGTLHFGTGRVEECLSEVKQNSKNWLSHASREFEETFEDSSPNSPDSFSENSSRHWLEDYIDNYASRSYDEAMILYEG